MLVFRLFLLVEILYLLWCNVGLLCNCYLWRLSVVFSIFFICCKLFGCMCNCGLLLKSGFCCNSCWICLISVELFIVGVWLMIWCVVFRVICISCEVIMLLSVLSVFWNLFINCCIWVWIGVCCVCVWVCFCFSFCVNFFWYFCVCFFCCFFVSLVL